MASLLSAARAQLAPSGELCAAVNLSNTVLVSGVDATSGEPHGVAPSLARHVAACLGVRLKLIQFPHPDKLVSAAEARSFAIGFVGADPAREKFLQFTPPWGDLEVTYLLRADSDIDSVSKVDSDGTVVAAKGGSAYHLWLGRNLQHAELVHAETQDAAFELFRNSHEVTALAGLRSSLLAYAQKSGSEGDFRVLDGRVMAVRQAIGCVRSKDGSTSGLDFVTKVVEEAKANGMVAELIAQHGRDSALSVAR